MMNGVKNVIIVMSGKGGVGKSTISSQIALSLEAMGFRVSICSLFVVPFSG